MVEQEFDDAEGHRSNSIGRKSLILEICGRGKELIVKDVEYNISIVI